MTPAIAPSRDPKYTCVPPTVTPPTEILSLPAYVATFVRNPLKVMPAVVYREPIAKMGDRITWVTDPPLVKRILLDEREDFPKSKLELQALRPLMGRGLLTSDGAEWKWQRQTSAPLFRHVDILEYVPTMTAAAEWCVEQWRGADLSSPRRVDLDTTQAAFRVISDTMLVTDEPQVTKAIERANHDYALPMSWPMVYAIIGLPGWFPYPGKRRHDEAAVEMRSSILRLVEKSRARDIKGTDLASRLIAARDPATGTGMTDTQMVDNLVTLLVAGHETTAKLVTWALYMLALLPAWQDRLLEEVLRVAGDKSITVEHVDQLKTTTMFVKETMRIYPPISSVGRFAGKDVELGGLQVKKGTFIVIPIFVIHRHRRLWEDPDRFDPMRFSPEAEAKQVRYQYMPFGAGPRICIGAAFSTIEATVMLATFVRAARFRLQEGYRAAPLSRITLQPRGGMPLHITMR